MAKHDDFAQEKLNALREPEGFEPSVARGRIQLQVRRGEASRRWTWKVAFAAVLLALFLAMPAARAVAQTGALSPDAYFQSVHQTFAHLHWAIYQLWQHF